MQNGWAYNEFWGVPLWDKRCTNTLISACQDLAQSATASFSRALGSRRKAVSHILHHDSTSPEDLLRGHVRATSRRCQSATQKRDPILVASDTTCCNFTTHTSVQGLGPINDGEARGILVHSALAITADGLPLGLLHQHGWARDPEHKGSAKQRRKRPYADKESVKWLDALRAVEKALPATQQALVIQDREADIFAFFCAPRRANVQLLIRAAYPRKVEVECPEGAARRSTLFVAARQAPVVARTEVLVRARPDREARQAQVVVRLAPLRICAPRNGYAGDGESVLVYVVSALEEEAPETVKEPLNWVLLCTQPVYGAADALEMVSFYTHRWLIERFHFVLKSGCGYEKLQVDTLGALQKALSLFSIVAWRLLHLTYLARTAPDAPAEEVISLSERDVLEAATGKPVSTVSEAVLAVAKIAGFVAVPSAGPPGVKSLWLGFRKLQDMLAGFLLAKQVCSRLKGQD